MKRESNNQLRRMSALALRRAQLGIPERVRNGARTAKVTPELEQFKLKLLQNALAGVPDDRTREWLSRAADEAASLAWSTAYPLLLLPEMMGEKLAVARLQAKRQRDIIARSRAILSLAA